MNRKSLDHPHLLTARLGRRRIRKPIRLGIEGLEQRVMMAGDLPTEIIVGRTLSAYTVAAVQNNQLRITYSVYNEQASEISGILLATTLQPGVSFVTATQSPDRNGQELAWSLGTLAPFERASIEVTVGLPTTIPLQIDGGASAFGTLDARAVTDSAPAAALRPGSIPAELLASTPDANTADPFIQEKAAELDYDAQRIFAYLRDEVGYESYRGSLRGARGTLWSAAGNALDEASLGVALYRASGIPARYARGTLAEPLAQQLILSMFSEPLRIVGLVDEGTPASDPANDPKLLAEARSHYWIQVDTGGEFVDADTTFRDGQLGQAFASLAGTFSEVADADRHKVTVRLEVEITNTATSLFGLPGQSVQSVLDQTFAVVAVVGRPLSVSSIVQRSAIGAPVFVSVTNTYTPYIDIGDVADLDTSDVIVGRSVQEVVTNFPFGSLILTGLFLEIELQGPDGPAETHRRALVDRIGEAVRRNGGSPGLTIDPTGLPAVIDTDVFNIDAVPGRFETEALIARLSPRLQQRQAALQALQDPNGTFPPEANLLLRTYYRDLTRLASARFYELSQETTDRLAELALVKAYYDRPRITITSSRAKSDGSGRAAAAALAIDLRRDTIRSVPIPGQAEKARQIFQYTYGVGENISERNTVALFVPPGTDQPVISTVTVFEAAATQGIDLIALAGSDLPALDVRLAASAEARVRITAALEVGKVVIVPRRPVALGDITTTAWYETDPTTGETIGVTEDGGHFAITEYAGALVVWTFNLGFLTQLFIIGLPPEQKKPWKDNVNAALDIIAGVGGVHEALQKDVRGIILVVALFGVFKGAQQLANVIFQSFDPPVGDLLMNATPIVTFPAPTGTGARSAIVPDPLYTVPFRGAQLPTAFRIGIQNLEATEQTFDLGAIVAPPGFVVRTSVPRITVPAGQTSEVGVYLVPTGDLPAAGFAASFTIRATSTTTVGLVTEATQPFVVPEIHGVSLLSDPPLVSTTPGVPVTATLTLRNDGNVPDLVDLAAVLSAGLTIDGLTGQVSLAVGETKVMTVTLTPNTATPLNSTVTAKITASAATSSAPLMQELVLAVRVAVPGADSIANAAVAAGQLGQNDLAARLDDLSVVLTNLVQDPTSDIFKSQAIASLDSVLSQLAADPVLSVFVADLAASRDVLAAAVTPSAIQAAVVGLGDALDEFGAGVSALTAGNFEILLLPNSQVAQPLTPVQFQILLHNIGTATTTYDVSLSGLPAGVTGVLSQTSITLARDDFSTTLFVTITPTSTTELSAFSFAVTVSPAGAPLVAKSATGSLTARSEFVSVVSVTADPPFVDPGGQVQVSARLLNAVNLQRQALASFVVRDSNGVQVFASSPVPAGLTVQTSLTTVALGSIDTSGFALGNYSIDVTLTDTGGQPIPGGTGRATLLIGSPVSASISVGPDVLAPGASTVTNTLVVASQVPLVGPLGVLSQTDLAGAGGVARHGQYLYASGSAGITVYDIADPSNPQPIRTFGSSASTLEIRGDKLYALTFGGPNGRFPLMIYSLTDPEDPQFLGTAKFNNEDGIPYGLAWNMVVTDTHVFVSLWSTTHLLGGQNDIKFQTGDVIAIDVSDPTAPVFVSALLNTYGTTNDGIGRFLNIDNSGGDGNLWEIVQVDADTLLVAGSTAAGDDTQAGNGVVHVVDISDPAHMTIVRTVVIPGTVQAVGLSIEGNVAFVTASQGGWSDPSPAGDHTGNLVLATLDITDPRNPSLLHAEVLDRPSAGPFSMRTTPLGNGLIAFSSFGGSQNQPGIYVVDASDPTQFVTSRTTIPAATANLDGEGNFLYATSPSGLIIYQIDAPDAVPATARVEIPNNTGVSIVGGSFSLEPTRVIPGTDFDTYEWDLSLSSGDLTRTITWHSTVINMQPGEARAVTLGTTIDFTSQGAPGQIALPSEVVAAEQILALDPATQTVRPGEAATYTLTLRNPTATAATYNLSVQGVPASWVSLISQITVGSQGSTSIPVTLTSGAFDALGEFGFTIVADTSTGTTGSVRGGVVLEGIPLVPPSDPEAHGVVLTLVPGQAVAGQGTMASFIVRVINTGSATDTFTLAATLPSGIVGVFGQTSVVIPPGASNFRDVMLTLTPQVGSGLGAFGFTVTAASGSATDTATGTLTVVANGVAVALNPPSNAPGVGFQLTVTNTGTVTDTFDLTLAGPGALVASIDLAQITLAPGASRVVPIRTSAINFALPGALNLNAVATSRGNPNVRDAASADLQIAGTLGLEAGFDDAVRILPGPGPGTFLLIVKNTGNVEDSYTAVISGTSGPVTARLVGLDGLPTQTIPSFRLPGLSTGAILLQADLASLGQGTITVQLRSLSDNGMTAQATAMVTAGATTSPTTTQLIVVPTSATLGQPITITAIVTAQGGSTPTGTVVFTVDGNPQTAIPLTIVNGQAQAVLTLTTLGVGTHSVTATYSGSAGFAASAFGPTSLVVNAVPIPVPTPDLVGPVITMIQRFGFHAQPTSLVLSFNEALNPAAAANLGNYRLVARGPDGRFGTRDDRVIRLRGAAYDPAKRAVTLRLSRLLPLRDTYRLTVSGAGIVDGAGNPLDGNGDGRPRGNFTTVINRRLLAGPASAHSVGVGTTSQRSQEANGPTSAAVDALLVNGAQLARPSRRAARLAHRR